MDDSWCGYRKVDSIYNLPEKFMTLRGTSRSKAKVIESSGNEHTLGYGVRRSGQNWGAGGGSAITVSYGSSASQGGLAGLRDIYNAVNYDDYSDSCSMTRYRKPAGYYNLVSKFPTAAAQPRPTGGCIFKYHDAEVGMSSAKNQTYSGGVDLGVVNVSSNAGYDHGVDYSYTFTGKTKVCFSNATGWPNSAKVWTYLP